MIMPGESTTEASRCVFIIDPAGKVRAMIYYPLLLGRNMQELLRVINALQMSDAHHIATPANWQPGQKIIVPAPITIEMAEERASSQDGLEPIDWYLCKKTV